MFGYDYFGDKYSSLKTADGKTNKKQLTDKSLTVRDAPLEYIPRDRLIPRQTYAQQQTVEGKNKNIVMTDSSTGLDVLFIGFEDASSS